MLKYAEVCNKFKNGEKIEQAMSLEHFVSKNLHVELCSKTHVMLGILNTLDFDCLIGIWSSFTMMSDNATEFDTMKL